MEGSKAYALFLLALTAIAITIHSLPTILPIMDDDEYYVDKNGVLHDKYCPYSKIPWFTQKHSKYDILIEADQTLCMECLSYDEDKLYVLHKLNLRNEITRMRLGQLPEEEIRAEILKYKTDYTD